MINDADNIRTYINQVSLTSRKTLPINEATIPLSVKRLWNPQADYQYLTEKVSDRLFKLWKKSAVASDNTGQSFIEWWHQLLATADKSHEANWKKVTENTLKFLIARETQNSDPLHAKLDDQHIMKICREIADIVAKDILKIDKKFQNFGTKEQRAIVMKIMGRLYPWWSMQRNLSIQLFVKWLFQNADIRKVFEGLDTKSGDRDMRPILVRTAFAWYRKTLMSTSTSSIRNVPTPFRPNNTTVLNPDENAWLFSQIDNLILQLIVLAEREQTRRSTEYFTQGEQAAESGLSSDKNPYRIESIPYNQWKAGYNSYHGEQTNGGASQNSDNNERPSEPTGGVQSVVRSWTAAGHSKESAELLLRAILAAK